MSQSASFATAALPRTGSPARRTALLPVPGAVFTALVLQLLAWQRRARERGSLATLSDAALRDVGLSRADIFEEIHKPFWRV